MKKQKNISIRSLHEGLLNGEFTATNLVVDFFKKIKKDDKKINAFISLCEERALIKAGEVDEQIKNKVKINLLAGIPVAIKDNLLVEGLKCTAGSKMLTNYVAPYSATVIERLEKAGAIIIGKTNMDEFAMGSSGETSNFGTTKNPLDQKKVPGGSSSGSAAAVAADMAVFALGSDTGGSIRQPASFCGLVGLKPTYGRVSRHGLIALSSSFDQIGPLTRSVEDSAIVFENIAGPDNFDSTLADEDVSVLSHLGASLKGQTVGIPKEFFVAGMDEEIKKKTEETIENLKSLGLKIKEISLPLSKYSLAIYYILMTAELSSNLSRFDGVRYGFRADNETLLEMYEKTRAMGFGDEVKRRIILGTFVLSSGYVDAYYRKAQKVRELIRAEFKNAFKEVDYIITPTSPCLPFNLGEKFNDPLTMYLSDIYTVSANVVGIPALSMPIGEIKNLPVGLQIMGDFYHEKEILNLASQIEKI
ncbi:MAG: Asp-tRNA(Asn)/Glu-tRNA(Gln) amidotransferase subunit GatA [Patescibacteria group bacterium]